MPLCDMCKEPIKDITSALCEPAGGHAVHFECALKSAEEQLRPEEGEKVIYLGNGSFAAVDSQAYQQRKLKIIRSVDWEKQEEKSAWRTDLRTHVD